MDYTKNGKSKRKMGASICQNHKDAAEVDATHLLLYTLLGHFCSNYMKKNKLFTNVPAVHSAALLYVLCPRDTGLSCVTLRRAWSSCISCTLSDSPEWVSEIPQVNSHGSACLYADNFLNPRMLRQQKWSSAA